MGLFQKGSPGYFEQTGRNVEQLYFCDGLAITDLNVHTTDEIDLSKYKKVTYSVVNTHDQDASIYIQQDRATLFYYDNATSTFKSSQTAGILVPTNTSPNDYVINDANPELFDRPMYGLMRFVVKFATAPTSGSISIMAWGLPN